MNKKVLLSAVLVGAVATPAEAANFAVITSPPVFLNLFILCFSVACVATTTKVYSLVRGGELSKGWQLLLAGFGMLALCEVMVLADAFDLLRIPSFVVPAGLVLMSGLFLYGILEVKRVLS